ncbi:acyltransferase domain-containing protein [Streptomyces sp. NPDC006367]|uniref:acyltransferase domain-containing protein n=1 Tax=unclassified Streptomyces TaxID=2593676 RepID=UPI0033B62E07
MRGAPPQPPWGPGPAGPGEEGFVHWLTSRIGEHARRAVRHDTPLAECGLDSVALLGVFGDIEEKYGRLPAPRDLRELATVRDLARHLLRRAGAFAAGPESGVRVAFVFTGQGCQHPRMTAGLHDDLVAYRNHLAAAAAALAPRLGWDVVELILSGDPRIHQTAFTQPALFAVQYALARTLLQEEEVRPVAVLGHGVGELAAATAAGSLTLSEAARMVSFRATMTRYLPSGGGMLATCASPYQAAEVIATEPRVHLAVVNAAQATVLSGDTAGLERAAARLAEQGIASRPLPVGHAFHSPLMEPMAARFEAAARHVPGRAPAVPYYSTVYGRELSTAPRADYWSRQLTSPVRFADAARALFAERRPTHVVEIGPKAVLTPFLRRLGGPAGPRCMAVCTGPESDAVSLAGVLSELDAGPLAES